MDSIALPVAIDNPSFTTEQKLTIIDKDRHQTLESLQVGLNQLDYDYTYAGELRALINRRFDQRKEMILNHENLWDYKVHLLLVVKGKKP